MANTPLKRLVALQNSGLREIQSMHAELCEVRAESLSRNNLQSRIESLQQVWLEARKTHADIVVKTRTENDVYMTANEYDRIRVAHRKLLDHLNNNLDRLNELNPPMTPALAADCTAAPRLVDAKLPKLDLPKFSGRYEDWESFCNLFNNLVHSKPASDATKLSYLKMCLTGTAADIVKDVAITDANYLTTWRALAVRYFNPRYIVNNHLQALMNLPQLRGESAVDLRSFADEARRIIRSLDTLKMPVKYWDVWLVHVLAGRLAPVTRERWESELSARDRAASLNADNNTPATPAGVDTLNRFPSFAEFVQFVETRAQTLSMSATGDAVDKMPLTSFGKNGSRLNQGSRRVHHAQRHVKSQQKCALCFGMHPLGRCSKLKAKNAYERRAEIRRLQLCFNCFGRHRVSDCKSKDRCHVCREGHHTLLHFDSKRSLANDKDQEGQSSSGLAAPEKLSTVLTAITSQHKYAIILATAQVTITGPNGRKTRARALLDQGSEATFVTESIAQLIGLPKRPTSITLSGLGANPSGIAKFATSLIIQSTRNPEFQIEADALILSRLTSHLPARSFIDVDFSEYSDLSLADPEFYLRDKIDIILGADVYGRLLMPGLRSSSTSQLTAQETALGWVLSGPLHTDGPRRAENTYSRRVKALHNVSIEDINESLTKFWNIEDFPEPLPKLKPEDKKCEELFDKTCRRSSQGRFTVRLPLKTDPPAAAAETRRMALGSLLSMHRRFLRDFTVAEAYRDFMADYEKLGHMERVPDKELDNPRAWYLPHHAVLTQKIRVVFDASRKTRDSRCLNEFLMSGPPLQNDIALVLLNWRRYRFVFTADLVKMFRQIHVTPEHRDYQRIVWSPVPPSRRACC